MVNIQCDFGQSGSVSIFANVTMQKLSSSLCNIHIQFGIEILNTESDNQNVFNMQYLKGYLGLSTLEFNPYNTSIRLINKAFPKVETSVRAGYNIDTSGNIGRFYKYGASNIDWSIFDVKSLTNERDFLSLDGLYEIDIFGAIYN